MAIFQNPPTVQEPVLQPTPEGKSQNAFSMAWYHWFVVVVAKLIEAPVQAKVPTTATSPGVAGQVATDGNFLYVCVAKNTWKQTALTTF